MEFFADSDAATLVAISMAAGNYGNPADRGGFLAATTRGCSDCGFPALRESADAGALRSVRTDFQRTRRANSPRTGSIRSNLCDLRDLLRCNDERGTVPNIRPSERRAIGPRGSRISWR